MVNISFSLIVFYNLLLVLEKIVFNVCIYIFLGRILTSHTNGTSVKERQNSSKHSLSKLSLRYEMTRCCSRSLINSIFVFSDEAKKFCKGPNENFKGHGLDF